MTKQETIDEITRRLVDFYHPVRIYLFGSEARGDIAAEEDALLQLERAREKQKMEDDHLSLRNPPRADLASFSKFFKRVIDEQTVHAGIPWAVSYDDLEKRRKAKIPAKVKNVRGKLNAPRERFHLQNKTTYVWAGLQLHTSDV